MSVRVLHLIPSMGGGGAERQVTYVARGLTQLGSTVHVGILRGGPNMALLERSGAAIHLMGASTNRDPRLPLRIGSLVTQLRPDIVQTWLMPMDILGGLAALATGRPWILSERCGPQLYGGPKYAARRFLARFASAVVANSASGAAYWSAAARATYVVGNAVDLDAITSSAPSADAFGSGAIVLFAGRLDAQKNVDTLIAALCQVVERRDATVLIAGVGPAEAAMRAQVAAARRGERIRFLGFVNNIWSLMKRADVLVAPSLFEGQPNVVIEAAACRCPLVVSDIPEHRAFLDERSALLVPPTRADALRDAVIAVIDDPEAARKRAANAFETVRVLSLERVAAEYLRVYESVSRN